MLHRKTYIVLLLAMTIVSALTWASVAEAYPVRCLACPTPPPKVATTATPDDVKTATPTPADWKTPTPESTATSTPLRAMSTNTPDKEQSPKRLKTRYPKGGK